MCHTNQTIVYHDSKIVPTPFNFKSHVTITIKAYICAIKPNTITLVVSKNNDANPTLEVTTDV